MAVPTRLRWFARRCALVAGGVIVALLAAELGVRAWLGWFASESQRIAAGHDWGTEPRFVLDPDVGYVLNPGMVRGETRHNSLGFRGPETTWDKPPEVFRIVAIGGSTTYTNCVADDEKTYPRQLERLLRDTYGHGHVEVINAGVDGYSTANSLANVKKRVLGLSPDLLVVYHAVNDVGRRLADPDVYARDDYDMRNWLVGAVSELPWYYHSALVRLLLTRMTAVPRIEGTDDVDAPEHWGDVDRALRVMRTNRPDRFAQNLLDIVTLAAQSKAGTVLATFAYNDSRQLWQLPPHYAVGVREHNDVIRALGRNHGIPVFDFARAMPRDPGLWVDCMHVNERGAELKAKLFAGFLVSEDGPDGLRPVK